MKPLEYIHQRIADKQQDFERYGFDEAENNVFKIFFDLAQELERKEELFNLCVAIPKVVFGIETRLYLIGHAGANLELAATTDGLGDADTHLMEGLETPGLIRDNAYALPIKGNRSLIDQLPFQTKDGTIGALVIEPMTGDIARRTLFFEKYANRIGFNIHNRFLVEKNIEHLRFIRNLVADIEHNIIAPNIVYSLYLRNLKGKIRKNAALESDLKTYINSGTTSLDGLNKSIGELEEVNRGLGTELENMERHYRNMSLFLETLLRRSHFDHGRLMPRTKLCNMKRDVLMPQLEQYAERFHNLGIELNAHTSGLPDEETVSTVDIGLLSQVYANLFSNALKYTQEVYNDRGERMKYLSYGYEILRNHFGEGKDGIKYNVYTTGPHLHPNEHTKIFEVGFRGRETSDRPGTGHGLAFVKNVIEIHGGTVGYEPTQYGNNFYFILPKEHKKPA